MNMKKTIAGVMAGAMAVSAMATMVSADQDSISLTYDLKTYTENKNKTKARVSFVADYAQGNVGYGFTLANYSGVITDKVAGSEHDTDYSIPVLTVGVGKGTYFGSYGDDGKYATTATATVSKLHDVEATFYPLPNANTNAVGSVTQTMPVTGKWVNAGAGDVDDYVMKGFTKAGTNQWGGSALDTTFNIGLDTTGTYKKSSQVLNISGFDTAKLGQSAVDGCSHVFLYGTIKMTYEVPASVYTRVASTDVGKWQGVSTGSQIEGTWGGTIYEALGIDVDGWKTLGLADYVTGVSNVTSGISKESQPLKGGAFVAGADTETIKPLKSSLTAPANVTNALISRKAGGKYYTNPVAVLNDAIANNENVVFEFKSYNGYVATAKSKIYGGGWIEADVAYGYQTTPYDWYNPTFGQHLYTNLDNSYSLMGSTEFDMYGSYSSAWAQNLFTGAIVVNSGLTMQLSDTDKFNWGNDSLSFDWFTITDEGKVTEAKTFLTKMLLYTPVDWYWDTLTVTVGNLEDDDNVVPGAGAGEDSDVIDDTDDGGIVIDPVEVEPVVEVTEPVVVTEAPVTAAATPVAPVESPKTGNAPVALAVIPVALAAAAVVAKKRG